MNKRVEELLQSNFCVNGVSGEVHYDDNKYSDRYADGYDYIYHDTYDDRYHDSYDDGR